MFDFYEADVLRDYREKKASGALKTNLSHPTPAKLKKECMEVFDKGYLKKDEMALRSFFDLKGDPETYRLAIKKWETDKFRQLNAVLRTGSIKTDEKNIELLAWLTGFQPRPFAFWLKEHNAKTGDDNQDLADKLPAGELIDSGKKPQLVDEPSSDLLGPPPAPPTGGTNKIMAFAILIVLAGIIGYFLVTRRSQSGQEKCMYWAGNQYELISCTEKPTDTTITVIGLDSIKRANFKRITRADTLTANSIGKVWYVKTPNGFEYYTSPGQHPIFTDKRLLPLTTGHLNKYPRKPG